MIKNDIVNALQAYLTSTGYTVEQWKTNDAEIEDLPLIVIRDKKDDFEYFTNHVEHTLYVSITIHAIEDMQTIVSTVYDTIADNLLGYCYDMYVVTDECEIIHEESRVITTTIDVVYKFSTPRNDFSIVYFY